MLLAVSVVLSAAQEPLRRDSSDARSLIAAGLYDDAEIAARAALAELRSAPGDHAEGVATAADTLVSALIFNGRAASAQTLQLAERTLQAGETRLGPLHAALLPSLMNLGEVLIAAIEFDRAVVVARRALSISERAGFVGLDQARVLGHLGRALGAAGRYDEALSCLERSVRLTEEAVAPGEPELARALEDITLVLQRKGSYDAAGVAIRRAERIQQTSDPLHPAFARTLNLVAQQFWFEGDLLQSKEASQRAVAVAEQTLRPDHPVALSLRYLAGTLSDLGDLIGSLTLARRALAIAETELWTGPSRDR